MTVQIGKYDIAKIKVVGGYTNILVLKRQNLSYVGKKSGAGILFFATGSGHNHRQ